MAEFQNYRTPDDGRRFTELYNVAKLSSAGLLGSTKVTISTIQRVYKFLQEGEVSDTDDPGLDDFVPDIPVTVTAPRSASRALRSRPAPSCPPWIAVPGCRSSRRWTGTWSTARHSSTGL